MPPKVLNVDVRSVDRDTNRYPNAADFSIDLGREFPNVSNLKLGSLEVPNTRYSVEDSENCLFMNEGFAVGTEDMDLDYNRLTLNGEALVVPATLMPVAAFDGTQITTKQAHGLQKYIEWSLQDDNRPKALFVGAEPAPLAKKSMRTGIYLHTFANDIQYPDATRLVIPENIVRSFGVGSSSTGYIHVPTLHFNEMLSLLNYISTKNRIRFEDGRLHFDQYTACAFPRSPEGLVVSLGELLGLRNAGVHDYAPLTPYISKVRIPPGFYANPPSLIANSVEEAIMNRGLITVGGNFKITQMDALFSETVTINEGLYTPELLQDTMQQLISSDTSIVVEHVDDNGTPRDGWVRWTIRSEEGFPFELDFSGTNSAGVARVLGFRQRRYSGHISYSGNAFSVPATRNVLPAPSPSQTSGTSRGSIRRTVEDVYRYNTGVYTITGTSPSQQRFTLFTEPSQSFAVPNTGFQRNFYESAFGSGLIDITTSGMASPQSYGFRRGDVVRLTGVSEETVPTLAVVNTNIKSAQIAGANVQVGVVGVLADLGGSNYDANMPPSISVQTPTRSGQHPTITPHIVNGNIITCSLQDHSSGPAEYNTPPMFSVTPPPSWSVKSVTVELLHSPERKRARMVVAGQTIVGVSAGRAAVVTNMAGETKKRLYRVVSVQAQGDDFEVLVETEALDATPLEPAHFAGSVVRFGISDAVPIATVEGNKRVTLVSSIPSAGPGRGVLLSNVAYANVVGIVTTISVSGTTATVTHNNLLTAPIVTDSRIVLRNANHFDGVWIVTATGGGGSNLQGNQFTFTVDTSNGTPADFNGGATLGAMNCSTCAPLVTVAVGTPQQRPTLSFDAVEVPYANFTGVGGMCAYAPEPVDATFSPILVDNALDTVRPCISGFLQTAFSTANLNAEGAPIVSFSGGATVSDVFNSAINATAASSAVGGELVVPDEVAYVQLGSGERSNVLVGRFTNVEVTFTADASNALVVGTAYKITNAGTAQTVWTHVGAASGATVGTVFTATGTSAGNNSGVAVRVRNYSGTGNNAHAPLVVGMPVTQSGTNAVGTIAVAESGSAVSSIFVKPISGLFNANAPIVIKASTANSAATVDTIASGDIFAANSLLRLTLDNAIAPTMTGAGLILSNFYFDGVFVAKTVNTFAGDWESVLDGNEIIAGRRELVLRVQTLASIHISMNGALYPINPVTTEYVYPSMFHVQWGGQYTNASGVEASIGVSNDVSTRTGIVTYARFENSAFRYLIEYNHRGLNNGRGFEDTVANNGNIILTFSRIAEPRSEYFGGSASALARHDPEMSSKVSAFTEQIILRRLGIIRDVFGKSQHLASSQWYLEGQPYRILQFFDEQGNKLGETSHTHTMSRQHETDIFGKLIIPAAYNTVRFQALELSFTRPKTLRVIRIKLLGYDEMPYPLHGRELTFSLLLTCNMELQ